MIRAGAFSINTFDKQALAKARQMGFGLEIAEYLLTYNADEIIMKQKYVPELMKGFTNLSFHGTAINPDLNQISKLSADELLDIFNESYSYANFHNIHKIVYHSDYNRAVEDESSWIDRKVIFWRQFLRDKPDFLEIYLENFIDDTPNLLVQLYDKIDDERFKICLDTGHACCNSNIRLDEWIMQLGKRIEHVHLHNNDGITDKHWPLGKGILDFNNIFECLIEYANVETYILECNFDDSLQWLHHNGILTSDK